MKNISSIFAFAILISVMIACSGDDTQKANQIVSEANEFIAKANVSVEKASDLGYKLDELLGSVENRSDLEKARESARELSAEYDSMTENFTKGGEKFDEASKLNLKEKHKEYLETKAKEMKLRAAYSSEMKKIPTELIENDDRSRFRDVMGTQIEKVKTMTQEAKDLSDKADAIVKENPDIMQQSSQK